MVIGPGLRPLRLHRPRSIAVAVVVVTLLLLALCTAVSAQAPSITVEPKAADSLRAAEAKVRRATSAGWSPAESLRDRLLSTNR